MNIVHFISCASLLISVLSHRFVRKLVPTNSNPENRTRSISLLLWWASLFIRIRQPIVECASAHSDLFNCKLRHCNANGFRKTSRLPYITVRYSIHTKSGWITVFRNFIKFSFWTRNTHTKRKKPPACKHYDRCIPFRIRNALATFYFHIENIRIIFFPTFNSFGEGNLYLTSGQAKNNN